MGTGAGWFIAIPGMLGVALWETASNLTRRGSLFNATIFWQATFLLLVGLGILLMNLWISAVGVVMIGVVTVWSRKFRKWKVQRVQQGQKTESG